MHKPAHGDVLGEDIKPHRKNEIKYFKDISKKCKSTFTFSDFIIACSWNCHLGLRHGAG